MKDYIALDTEKCIELGTIAFLDGTDLPETEHAIFKSFTDRNFTEVWSLENLYEFPERILALKYLKPQTIVTGTTAVMADKLNWLVDAFIEISHIPDNIILTHGGEYFIRLIKDLMKEKPSIRVYDAVDFDGIQLYEVTDNLNQLIR